MNKLNYYISAFLAIGVLGPFYLLGFIVGQPIAAIFYGHEIGRETYLDFMKERRRKAERD